jgi:uncharacterized membrane protein
MHTQHIIITMIHNQASRENHGMNTSMASCTSHAPPVHTCKPTISNLNYFACYIFSCRSRAAATRAGPQVNNYSTTIVAAPPVYSPFGFGGFGYGGFSFMPVVPIPFFGGILQFMFLMLIVSFVFNVIKGAIGAASGANSNKSKSQDWDDL